MIDAFEEFAEALDATYRTESVHAWLNRRGLTMERRRLVGGVAVMKVSLSRTTWTFEPNPDGELVLAAVVWGGRATLAYSDPHDVIAWRPAVPGEHYSRLGVGTILGRGGLSLALRTASPLRLHRTAESFIASGGERDGPFPAAVLLNHGMAYLHLRDLPAIIADDIGHGVELEATLNEQRPPAPPIRIPAEQVAV